MQPGNPYHLIEAVGSCQVGSVWSAIDPQGRSLMVALLDPNVATDQRWREAFQEAANALVQAGEPGYLYADFASASPWVAYSAENGIGAERVFLALGMDFQPVPPDGLGPMDYAPFEPATHETPAVAETPSTPEAPPTQVIPATPVAQTPPATSAPPEQPVTPPHQQPLPPDVLASAEAPPTRRIIFGKINSIARSTKGRQTFCSAGVGVRLPGGRQKTVLVMNTRSASPASFSIRSSSCPALPTNGRPCRSSLAPHQPMSRAS